jgi:hypothetical protein
VKKGLQFFLLGSLLLAFLPAGFAQQPSSPDSSALQTATQSTTDQSTKPTTKKVWTDDNIGQVRTPEDVYLDQKRAAEEAARQQKQQPAPPAQAAAAKPAGRGPIVLKIPDTVGETQQAIAQRQAMFDNFANLLNVTQKQLDGQTDPTVRATLAQKAGLLKGDVADTRADLDQLQKRLAELQAKQKAGDSASPDGSQQ